MTQPPDDHRIEILLKSERRDHRSEHGTRLRAGGPAAPSSNGQGRWLAALLLGALYLVVLSVCAESFTPRAEWVDGAGRTVLEDRPVFWPLILFALLGRVLSGVVAFYPHWSDPARGLFPVAESPALSRRRVVFRLFYFTGLALALVTLVNNLAFADLVDIATAVVTVLAILIGITLLFRLALLSLLTRMEDRLRRR